MDVVTSQRGLRWFRGSLRSHLNHRDRGHETLSL